MKVEPLRPENVNPPPRWLLQHYLPLVAGRRPNGGDSEDTVNHAVLRRTAGSDTAAKQLAHLWTKYFLAVRLRHGEYALVDPSVAIRAWAIPLYYAELLTLHDALKSQGTPHAFACLTAATGSDYVPATAFVVLPYRERHRTDKLDAFYYDFEPSKPSLTRLDVLGERFDVPTLPPAEAAVVFAATGLPREVEVARQLIRETRVALPLARHLNYLGISTSPHTFEAENPNVTLPPWAQARRREYADAVLRGRA